MCSEFSVRPTVIVISLIIGACLVAACLTGTEHDDSRPSKDTCRAISLNEVADNTLPVTAILTKTHEDPGFTDTRGAEKVVSDELGPRFTTQESIFGAPEWPQQGAAAYGAPHRLGTVGSTFDRLHEKGLVSEFSVYRVKEASHKCSIPEINENRGTMPSEQFSYWFHGHSATSHGSVLVNF